MAGLKGAHGPLKAGLHAILLAGTAASSPPPATASITSAVPATGTVGVAISGLAYISANVATLYLAVIQGGTQISRAALASASGQLPSYTPSSAGSDQFALYSVASGGVALYTSPVITVGQAPAETLVLNPASGNVTSGSTFALSGTLSNVSTQPALSISVDQGAFIAMAAASPYLLTFTPSTGAPTGFTFTGQALSTGQHTVQVKDTTHGLSSNTITVTAAAPATGGAGVVRNGSYFGAVGIKSGTLSGLPTTGIAGQPLNPAGSFALSGAPPFGTSAYVGLWNATLNQYEMGLFYNGTLLSPLTGTSGSLSVFGGDPRNYNVSAGTWNFSALTPSLYNGGGTYTVRLCADPNGRFVLAESPPITVSAPAFPATTSIYPATVACAPGKGTVFTVGPGKQYATISNLMEAATQDLLTNGQNSIFWDGVAQVYTAPAGYYLDDCGTGSCPSSAPFTGNTNQDFKGYMPNAPFTIRGVLDGSGNRPHFTWDGNGEYFGKGYWLKGSYPLTIENIYFTGPGGPSTEAPGNLPFVFLGDSHAGDLQLNNVLVEYVSDGTSGGQPGFGIYVRNSEFRYCSNSGPSGDTHFMYVTQAEEFIVTDSLYHHPGYKAVGHIIKSRAKRTHLIRTRLQDGEGNGSSYVLDLPEQGDVLLQDVILHHGPGAHNSPCCRAGEEGNLNYGTYYDGIYLMPARNVWQNVYMFNEVPTSAGYGEISGLDVSNYVNTPMPHAQMSGTRVFGMGLNSGQDIYFENDNPLVPPDPNVIQFSSLPTLDFSSPPATGQADPTAAMPTAGTALTTGATGGTITAPSSPVGGQLSTASATLSGGNIGWISYSGPNGEELPRTAVQGGQASVAPQSTGSYAASLWGAPSGGSALAATGSFTVAVPTPTLLAAPGGVTVMAAYSEGAIVSSGLVSGLGSVTYALGYQTGGGAWQTVAGTVNTEGTAILYYLSQLAPGTSYQIIVGAVDQTGPGAPSTAITLTTAAAGTNFANDLGSDTCTISFDTTPSGPIGGANATYGGAGVGKVVVSTNGPDPVLIWSASNSDPTLNTLAKFSFQGLTEYSPGTWYNNGVNSAATGTTAYLWAVMADGRCACQGAAYTFD